MPSYLLPTTLFLLLLTQCASAPATDSAPANAPKRPNILFIMSDDHAQRAISAYTDELIETPNLDRIAEEGMLFRNSFVTNSICAPSRAAILTGLYSHLNGKIDNLSPFNAQQWTFPEALHDAGYRTSLIGKHHLQAMPRGFDEFRGLIGQGDYYSPKFVHNGDTLAKMSGYTTNIITDFALEELQRSADSDQPFMMLYWHKAPHRNWMPDTVDLPGLLEERYTEPANLRDDYAGRPRAEHADMRIADMFTSTDLMVSGDYQNPDPGTGGATFITDPEWDNITNFNYIMDGLSPEERAAYAPFLEEVGKQWLEVKGTDRELGWRYQRYMQDYLASVKSVDRNVGRILDYLDESGLAENTIVIYTSDQGFYLGEHGWYDKRFMYEESHRTPLLVRYPGVIEAGTETEQLVLNIDLAPTLLELAGTSREQATISGVDVPSDTLQGRSLLPLFRGEAPADWRDQVYYRYYQQMNSYHRVARHEGVRDERYKLIHFTEPGFEGYELYDLQEDPTEMENRIDDEALAEVRERLMGELAALRERLGVVD